jgi:HK97 family phage major capsid protein
MQTQTEILDEFHRTWKSFRAEHERLLSERKQTSETLEAHNKRLDELETALNRIQRAHAPEPSSPSVDHKAAFFAFVRNGMSALTEQQRAVLVPTEAKALSSVSGAEAMAPPEIATEIIRAVVQYSPVRAVARVRQTASKTVRFPKRTGLLSATWTAKLADRPVATGQQYGVEEIPTHEMTAIVDVATEDLEDAAINLETELAADVATQFGVLEGKAFIAGDSVSEPEGLLTNTAIGYTPSGDATKITADGMIDLFFALKEPYARRGTWLLRRETVGIIRRLKDGMGQYLWQPGLAGGAPATILDRPYYEAIDMPAVGANAFPVLFGDFQSGYYVIDRTQMIVLRDPFTVAHQGMVRFVFRRRIGGQVVLAEAIRKLKIATS